MAPQFMNRDLSYYLGEDYKGEYPEKYVLKEPKPRMPLYHLVSAIDPLVDSDIKQRVNDGLPETLPEWINYNGLTHFKIKLDGDDLKWDSERVLSVDRVVTETEQKRRVTDWVYSLDFNERCPNVQYLVDFLHRVKDKSPGGFARIQYVEQPTARDLDTHRQNVMFEAAKLKPVVIDESLTDLHALETFPRDGVHRRRAQSLQRSEQHDDPRSLYGKEQDVPLRAGPDLPRRFADSIREFGRARSRRQSH